MVRGIIGRFTRNYVLSGFPVGVWSVVSVPSSSLSLSLASLLCMKRRKDRRRTTRVIDSCPNDVFTYANGVLSAYLDPRIRHVFCSPYRIGVILLIPALIRAILKSFHHGSRISSPFHSRTIVSQLVRVNRFSKAGRWITASRIYSFLSRVFLIAIDTA